MVAYLDGGDTLADRLDDAGALVAKDNGEGAFGVLTRERVCICTGHIRISKAQSSADVMLIVIIVGMHEPVWQTPV